MKPESSQKEGNKDQIRNRLNRDLKREKRTYINVVRNERENVTTDTTEIQKDYKRIP